MEICEPGGIKLPVFLETGDKFGMAALWTEKADVWQLHGEQAGQGGEIATEIVGHDDCGGLVVGLEILGEFVGVAVAVDLPAEGGGEEAERGDFRTVSEKQETCRERNGLDECVGCLDDERLVRENSGAPVL